MFCISNIINEWVSISAAPDSIHSKSFAIKRKLICHQTKARANLILE